MTRTTALLEAIAGRLAGWNENCLFVLIATFSILALVQVILRYGFNRGLFWADELTLFAFTWSIFLSAALALERKSHFGVQVVVDRLPAQVRRGTALGVHLVMMGVVIFLLWFGVEHSLVNWAQVSDVLRVPLTWWYLCLPVACLSMLVSLLRDVCILVSGGKLASPQDELV